MLRRPLGLPSCGDQLRRRTIGNVLSSLTGQLHQHRYPAATREDLESEEEWLPRPNRRGSYEEALRVACQRALDTSEVLWDDMKRLSQRTRDTSQTRSGSHSRSHTQSRGRSHSRCHTRSRGTSQSRSCPQGSSQSRWPRSPSGPPPGRRVTFREPELEPNSKGGVEDYLLEPPVSDMKTWLEWQACQLSTPAWWSELTAILGVKDLQKLACKTWASFSIPEVRMRAFLEQEYTVTLTPKCLNRKAFLLDELSYLDVWQQFVLLMVTYAWGLQYWTEKLNLPESPDFHLLVGSIVELREKVWEHVTFTNWDILQGIGAVHLGATSQWPQATVFSQVLLTLVDKLDFTEATTHTAPPAVADVDMARCTTPLFGMERENCYLLVITTSIGKLSLGPSGNNPKRSPNDSPRGNTFWNPQMAAVFSGSTRAVGHRGATVKELK